MGITQIRQIAAYARDLDEAIHFYRDLLGARFIARFDPPGLGFFDFNGVRLMLDGNVSKITIYFAVDDLHAAHRELVANGITFLQAPELVHRDDNGTFGRAGAEEWMAFFHDPSGNTLALAERR